MVDAGRVVALLERIRAEVKAVKDTTTRDDRVLLEDDDALPALKYRLIVAIEAAIDVADHIIASEGLRVAQTLADSFVALEEGGWLGHGLAERMQEAARFRNLLVHQYADVDDRRVLAIARQRVDDLEDFCRSVAQRLS